MAPTPLEEIVERVVTGDSAAWGELWTKLEPKLQAMVRRPRFLGTLSHREDDRRNVVVEIMRRLHENEYRRLAAFMAARQADPTLEFLPWLTVVAKRMAIDYIRAHGEYIDRRYSAKEGEPAGEWVDPITLPSESRLPAERFAITDATAASQMLSYAGHVLPNDQHQAIELWIRGVTFADIARQLGLGEPIEAERRVRAGLERLRRHFQDR